MKSAPSAAEVEASIEIEITPPGPPGTKPWWTLFWEASRSVGSNGETVLRLNAEQAFGVGVHPSISAALTPQILMLPNAIDGGRSYRWVARDLGLSKNTVTVIVKRHRANP